ncbi:MAG: hypothetical protein OXT65_00480 [Alphaproteobacteria bacterium]|nr:hypothetical protein [Alphaproteobacteria bacterium]
MGSNPNGGGHYSQLITLPYVSDTICLEINKNLFGIDSIPVDTDDNPRTWLYGGSLSNGNYIDCETTDLPGTNCGGETGCFAASQINSSAGGNLFYQIVYRDPP